MTLPKKKKKKWTMMETFGNTIAPLAKGQFWEAAFKEQIQEIILRGAAVKLTPTW